MQGWNWVGDVSESLGRGSRSLSLVGLVVLLAGLGCVEESPLPAGPEGHPASPFLAGPAGEEPAAHVQRAQALEISPDVAHAARLLVVDDDFEQCPGADHTTIQAAVDVAAAAPGRQIIRICAGRYAEDVAIGPDNRLTLRGAGESTVLIGSLGSAEPIVHVIGSAVDIRDLTIDGLSARGGPVVYGILYENASGRLEGNAVRNIRNATGSAQGIGIAIRDGNGRRTAVVSNTVENYTRAGILADGSGTRARIDDNDVVGPTLPRVWAPNGIQVSRGAVAIVTDNEVDNNPSPNPPGGAGSGIILFCAGPSRVKRNTVAGADIGISLADTAGARIRRNRIEGSGFDGISLQFIGFVYGVDLGCGVTPVEGNRIDRNFVEDSVQNGISLVNFDAASAPETPNDNRIVRNTVLDAGGVGLVVFADGDNPTGNAFKRNEIVGSALSCVDQSVDGGTAGTANTWVRNRGDAPSSPEALCGRSAP